MEADLTPISLPLTAAGLDNASFTAFLYPSVGGTGSVGYTTNWATKGSMVGGRCNTSSTPLYCNVDVTGFNATTVLLRLRTIYSNSQVSITGYSGATQLRLKGAQSLVDATGKAQDVLRRVQVRVPSRAVYSYPESAIEASDSVCKQLQVYPGSILPPGC